MILYNSLEKEESSLDIIVPNTWKTNNVWCLWMYPAFGCRHRRVWGLKKQKNELVPCIVKCFSHNYIFLSLTTAVQLILTSYERIANLSWMIVQFLNRRRTWIADKVGRDFYLIRYVIETRSNFVLCNLGEVLLYIGRNLIRWAEHLHTKFVLYQKYFLKNVTCTLSPIKNSKYEKNGKPRLGESIWVQIGPDARLLGRYTWLRLTLTFNLNKLANLEATTHPPSHWQK